MKNLSILIVLVLNIISLSSFASNEKGKESKRNYDETNAPKIKTAPFIKGVAAEHSLELFMEGVSHKMLVDTETDNILFDHLKEGKDFVRVYTDNADGNKAMVIWSIKKVNKKTGEIKWDLYSYKHFPTTGWRPVDNNKEKVKAFN
ncbi:hypothetical protein EI427_11670 [Flammeovirga pectinis]|uniref:Uncharacterized protein n=1 Tax=Flammeovirga pectinis TaxID=2494373 RepID=A0A3S9P3S2_9BACT|nr:hypothetical protein [Flammeovirga pectinis]AZQ62869.1 hypothetical protein EI427_11670 [Flammeovirga pectinis]